MINLTADCGECTHVGVCRYKYNARNAMSKLKNMTYDKGQNYDYDWDTIMKRDHVDIVFSCPNFSRKTLRLDREVNNND